MSDLPSVCAVMLTKDRPAMARQAIEYWQRQTYSSLLVIWDTGAIPLDLSWLPAKYSDGYTGVSFQRAERRATIGELRNDANRYAAAPRLGFPAADIIVHVDDDDFSHPNRIAEQVALLQASGADCVGYRECLFWRTRIMIDDRAMPDSYGEAWLYSNPDPRYCIGASLAYWRASWEKHPFPALPTGPESSSEDNEWLKGMRSAGSAGFSAQPPHDPLLICRIHSQNTMNYSRVLHQGPSWKRYPEFDSYCRERFA